MKRMGTGARQIIWPKHFRVRIYGMAECHLLPKFVWTHYAKTEVISRAWWELIVYLPWFRVVVNT